MAEVKSGQADRFVRNPGDQYFLYLIYGPDTGLVSERADKLAASAGVDLTDPFAAIRMDADHVAADRSRLADEAHTIGMFGGRRLIRVSGATRRNLAEVVRPVLESPPVDCSIIIEAGELRRDAPLRKLVEKHRAAIAIPCYSDTQADLERMIRSDVREAGLEIDDDAVRLLAGRLGADRRASRNEIEKLILYASERDRIDCDAVEALTGDAASLAMDSVIDAACTGDLAAFHTEFGRLGESGSPPDMLVLMTLRHFQTLQLLRSRMEAPGGNPVSAIQSLRPPVHFSRRDSLQKSLSIWNAEMVERALARLDRAVLDCRANAALSSSLAGTALLALAVEAAKRMRRKN